MRVAVRTLIAIPLLWLTACAPNDAVRAPGSNAASRTEVDAALARYAEFVHHMQADSIGALYAADGEMLPAGAPPIVGPDSIAAFLHRFDGMAVVDSETMASEVADARGDTAWQWGRWRQTARVNGRVFTPSGRFVAQWVRDDAHGWRIRRFLTQDAPPRER